MWQRKQTIFLFLVGVLMIVTAVIPGSMPLQVFSGLIALVALANIFCYSDRKRQMMICKVGIIMLLAWIGCCCYDHFCVNDGKQSFPMQDVMPVVSIILFWLAYKGIKHDDDLVRSADRIR